MISIHQALTGPSGAICLVATLRSLWLLPDWLAKWQSLIAYRRGLRGRDPADPHVATRQARKR